MSIGKQLRAEVARSLPFGSIVAGYAAIGSATTKPSSIIHVQNFTNADIWISYDGINDHFPLAAGAFMLLDITTNHPTEGGLFLSTGTQFYTKRIGTPTSGSVYVSLYYGKR